MDDSVHVEAARIPDRDRLLRELQEAGLAAHAEGEIEIVVPYGDDADGAGGDVLATIEHAIMSVGAPFVPQKHEGIIYIRPPVG